MTPRLPFYIEVDSSAQVDAWLEQDGRRLPLKRMFDDGDPAVLRGAPTRAEAEREFARHFGDVRAGAALLQRALQQSESEDIRLGRIPPPAEWVKSLMAAMELLRRIVEVGDAFERSVRSDIAHRSEDDEDAVAGAG